MFTIRTLEEMSDVSAILEGNDVHTLLEAHLERLAEYDGFDLTELAMFAVISPTDTLEAIEDQLGRKLLNENGRFIDPPEIIDRHPGWFEVAFILSDDGFGLVLFVPIGDATEAKLLAACTKAFAQSRPASEA